MREVLSKTLWLGNAADARNLAGVLDKGILALVDLTAEELPPKLTREIVYCRFPLVDGTGNSPLLLRGAVEVTAGFIRKEIPTLVYCNAGMSRAPCIAAAALAIVRGDDPDEQLRSITSDQPHDISPALWGEIKEACTD